jgi:hypothetical protein
MGIVKQSLLATLILTASWATAAAEGIDLGISFRAFGGTTTQLATDNSIFSRSLFWSDASEQALDAYRSGDYETAREIWEDEAEAGDLIGQWHLAIMHRLGQGVRVDNATALRYYEMAASQFDADRSNPDVFSLTRDALFWVAYYNYVGDEQAGIQSRPAFAFRLYTTTANHGHAGSQFYIGIMFLNGQGITRDSRQGMRWLNLAAQKRYAAAMAQLGEIYWQGELQEQNRARGLMWYTLASESAREEENPEIFNRYEELYLEADDEERRMAEGLALQWSQHNPGTE